MACNCTKQSSQHYLWYDPANPEGVKPIIYTSEIQAKAKVLRKGGRYIPYDASQSIGNQIAIAEAR